MFGSSYGFIKIEDILVRVLVYVFRYHVDYVALHQGIELLLLIEMGHYKLPLEAQVPFLYFDSDVFPVRAVLLLLMSDFYHLCACQSVDSETKIVKQMNKLFSFDKKKIQINTIFLLITVYTYSSMTSSNTTL